MIYYLRHIPNWCGRKRGFMRSQPERQQQIQECYNDISIVQHEILFLQRELEGYYEEERVTGGQLAATAPTARRLRQMHEELSDLKARLARLKSQ